MNSKNLVGLKFNKLLVLDSVHRCNSNYIHWKCLCECGNEKIVCGNQLTQNKYKSCGCSRYKYKMNQCAFDTITEESAYWIGFWMADGSISNKSSHCSIELQTKDTGHLFRFQYFLESNCPIKYTSRPDGRSTCLFSFSSKKIKDDMIKNNVIPNKSKLAKVPLTLCLNRHFWRGMIDGDGSIGCYTINKGKPNEIKDRWNIILCGTESICNGFLNFAKQNFKTKAKSKKSKRKNVWKIVFQHKMASKLIEILYSHSNISLHRKLEIAKVCINECRC